MESRALRSLLSLSLSSLSLALSLSLSKERLLLLFVFATYRIGVEKNDAVALGPGGERTSWTERGEMEGGK